MKYLLILFFCGSSYGQLDSLDILKQKVGEQQETIAWLKAQIDGLYHDNLTLRRNLEKTRFEQKKWYIKTNLVVTERGTFNTTGVAMAYRRWLFNVSVDPFYQDIPIVLIGFGYRIY